jgi:DNA polymerase-3 subunit delta'
MRQPFLGHTHTIQNLKHLCDSQRFPHTLLLHGPQSIGKSTLAHALAAHLLAQNSNHPPSYDNAHAFPFLPPQHPVQRLVDAKTHPDIFFLSSDEQKKSNAITIDATKNALNHIAFTPQQGKNMIVIIEEAENLNNASFNALLKTLEEPKPHLSFILCSHAPGKLAPTILSRAWMEPMFPLDDTLIDSLLENIEPPLRQSILSVAKGKPGFALALAHTKNISEFFSAIDEALSQPYAQNILHTFDIPQNIVLQTVRSLLHSKTLNILKNAPLEQQKNVHQAFEHSYKLLEDTELPLSMPFFPSLQQALSGFAQALS